MLGKGHFGHFPNKVELKRGGGTKPALVGNDRFFHGPYVLNENLPMQI